MSKLSSSSSQSSSWPAALHCQDQHHSDLCCHHFVPTQSMYTILHNPKQTHKLLFNPTQSNKLSNIPTQSHKLLSHTHNPTNSYAIPHNPKNSHTIRLNTIQSHTIPYNPTQSYTIPHNPRSSQGGRFLRKGDPSTGSRRPAQKGTDRRVLSIDIRDSCTN